MLLFLLYLELVYAMVPVLPHNGLLIHILHALVSHVQPASTCLSQPQQFRVTPPPFRNTLQPSPGHAQPSP